MPLPFLKKYEPSLSELEEERERKKTESEVVGAELSIAQKRYAIARLKERGLSPKHFNFDFKKIVAWLKSH